LPGLRRGPLPSSRSVAVETLAAAVVEAARGKPYILVGYSSGGVLANAIAGHLERSATTGPVGVVMLDTYEHASPTGAHLLANAMREIMSRNHAYVDITDGALLGLGAYVRLFGDALIQPIKAPTLLLRVLRPLAGWTGDDGAMGQTVVRADADHFSIIAEHADTAALEVERWLSALVPIPHR
jgi:polyketide synthase 7